jgi:hypothetical protein
MDEKLVRQVSLEDVLREHTYDGVPFGHARDDWERLLAKMQPGDELWEYEPASAHAVQTWGIALVRSGSLMSRVILVVD